MLVVPRRLRFVRDSLIIGQRVFGFRGRIARILSVVVSVRHQASNDQSRSDQDDDGRSRARGQSRGMIRRRSGRALDARDGTLLTSVASTHFRVRGKVPVIRTAPKGEHLVVVVAPGFLLKVIGLVATVELEVKDSRTKTLRDKGVLPWRPGPLVHVGLGTVSRAVLEEFAGVAVLARPSVEVKFHPGVVPTKFPADGFAFDDEVPHVLAAGQVALGGTGVDGAF